MSEAQFSGINWGSEQEATGQACLQNFDPAFYQNAAKKPKWVADTNGVLLCGMLKALLDAHRLVWCAQLRYDIRTGRITMEGAPSIAELVSGIPNPVGSQETRSKVREFAAGDPVLADVPALYDLVCFEAMQAIRSSRPIKEPKPLVGQSLAAINAQLGALPVIAIVALGVAALAGATYLGAEASVSFAKAWSAIEIEKAWAVARASAEVQIAQQNIASGMPYVMSDWAKSRAAVATASQTPWVPLALGGALAAIIGASAYLLRDKPAAVHHANPAHFVPRRRRLRRKKNAARALPAAKPRKRNPAKKRNAAPKRKRNPAKKRNAAPKRKRNPSKKRNPQPRKRKSARKDARKRTVRPSAKFLRSQRAKGRSDAQARAAWKLSHKRKARSGKR